MTNDAKNSRLYVHPEVRAFLSQQVLPHHPAFDENDRLLARWFYSADDHDPATLYAFSRVLDHKITVLGYPEPDRLHRALAEDDF